ncbi:MAG: septal ring lytic transglycosylase RlpA family protein [Gammaproteobacteria bacterium]|nr:septal ring lytic transglycosylase RlpA family protein [Gammaproteobacteria bacterium]MCY4324054.1 septal ring lytic transglycosylase RlpA family protein [Gammaproteobacteria bacterium]
MTRASSRRLRRRNSRLQIQAVGAILTAVLLSGCTRLSGGRDAEADGIPSRPISKVMEVAESQPKWEPRAKLGNHSPYEVFGKTYHVLSTADGYDETGIASWYGTKFHGRKTSSGEIYDVYQLSAAHRSLPLPTWVKVTNLENKRTLVVRVNDRGPFKEGRIIDLSYAAAVRLGVFPAGTAKVRVEAIPLEKPSRFSRSTTAQQTRYFVQAGAFRERSNAAQLEARIKAKDIGRISTERSLAGNLFRVLVGPFATRSEAESAKRKLRSRLGIRALIID